VELVIGSYKNGGLRYNGFAVAVTGDQPLSKLGRYELVTQIGHGGMAEVQLALQRGPAGFEKLVVIKLVHANLAKEKTFVDMLLDEARVAALVKHPNVVDIYDLGEAEGRFFIAMEYLEGEPLLGLLRAGRDGKRLDALSTARLIADTAEGLDAAHELQSIGGDPMELVHHDVSLGNIMVLYNGQVKLVDFGVAKASQNAGPQMKVHGKFGYMAPEKLKGRGSDRRGDIWSLGVVLWEALTLRRLFRGVNEQETMRMVLENVIAKPSTMTKESIPALDDIVMKALERDPEKRYRRAKDLAVDIEEVLRQHGYGGRNDQISKYMQTTFASHITARKKLLQEVMSKGKASAAVLEAAFDDSISEIPGKPRGIRASGEFSIAFKATRDSLVTPTSGVRVTRQFGSQTIEEETSSVFAARRESQEMMAEGTPHSVVTNLPKRVTKQMFAEATPVITDPDVPPYRDPEAYDRGKYPRADTRASTDPVYREGAVDAMVASLAPSPEPSPGESDAAVLAMVASLEPKATALGSSPQVMEARLPEARAASQIAKVLDRFDAGGHALEITPINDEPEEPSRPSQRMNAVTTPRPTSRRLEVVKPPQALHSHAQPVAVIVEKKSISLPLLIAIAIVVLALVGMIVFAALL
jgi:serine/threonine protein kinase